MSCLFMLKTTILCNFHHLPLRFPCYVFLQWQFFDKVVRHICLQQHASRMETNSDGNVASVAFGYRSFKMPSLYFPPTQRKFLLYGFQENCLPHQLSKLPLFTIKKLSMRTSSSVREKICWCVSKFLVEQCFLNF